MYLFVLLFIVIDFLISAAFWMRIIEEISIFGRIYANLVY